MGEITPRIGQAIRQAMPKAGFEFSDKQLEILTTTSRVLLALGILTGGLTIAAIAPNAFQMLEILPWFRRAAGPKRPRREYLKLQEQKIRKAVYYLKASGYIELVPHKGDFLLKVTRKGKKFERRIKFADIRVKKEKHWNRQWWAVAADIPTPYKNSADALRDKLKEMKFYFLQRTLWFYPFDPRDEIDFLTTYLHIDRFVTVMSVQEIDPADDQVLRKYFRKEGMI